MSNPRPDSNEIKKIIDKKTGLNWTIKTDKPNQLTLQRSHFKLDITHNGDHWTLNLYDHSSNHSTTEPRWALGPLHTPQEIKNELPTFLPKETHRR